jgi:hypothetical protein
MPVFVGDNAPRATVLPFPHNTVADHYDAGAAVPTHAAVPIRLIANISCPTNNAEDTLSYSHIALVPATLAIRDNKTSAFTSATGDTLKVNGTPYRVTHVELVGRGTPVEHKKVYLDRGQPSWPTNDL